MCRATLDGAHVGQSVSIEADGRYGEAAPGRYGTALSVAVLAFEEAVKGRTLAAIASDGSHAAFSDDELRKIISSPCSRMAWPADLSDRVWPGFGRPLPWHR